MCMYVCVCVCVCVCVQHVRSKYQVGCEWESCVIAANKAWTVTGPDPSALWISELLDEVMFSLRSNLLKSQGAYEKLEMLMFPLLLCWWKLIRSKCFNDGFDYSAISQTFRTPKLICSVISETFGTPESAFIQNQLHCSFLCEELRGSVTTFLISFRPAATPTPVRKLIEK